MHHFTMPSLGSDMDEGRLVEWRVAPGDVVANGQIVAVVDTAKAALEVECWRGGVVHELLVEPGETAQVGTPLAVLLEPGEAPPPRGAMPVPSEHGQATAAAAPVVAAVSADGEPTSGEPSAATQRSPLGPRASPSARRRARELGVDLARLAGSSAGGSITTRDIERAAEGAAPAAVTAEANAARTAPAAPAAPVAPAAAPPAAAAAEDIAAARARELRRTIADAMSRSKRQIPHYYLATKVPLEAAHAWLARANEGRGIAERIVLAALLLRAVALAVRDFPDVNGWYREGRYEPQDDVHLGVAVSLRGGGVIAPVLRHADRLGTGELMAALADLVGRARAGKLKGSELGHATITVTSLGERGVDQVLGVIHPPQVALVGFGTPRPRPWIVDGEVRPVPVVEATLAADHRVSDGHRGALFLARIAEILRHPEELD